MGALAPNTPEALRTMRKLAELLRRRGEPVEARRLLEDAARRARELASPSEMAWCALSSARLHMYQGELTDALTAAHAGHTLAAGAGARSLASRLSKTISDIELYRGEATAALPFAERAIAEAEGEAEALADALGSYGRLCFHRCDYATAVVTL